MEPAKYQVYGPVGPFFSYVRPGDWRRQHGAKRLIGPDAAGNCQHARTLLINRLREWVDAIDGKLQSSAEAAKLRPLPASASQGEDDEKELEQKVNCHWPTRTSAAQGRPRHRDPEKDRQIAELWVGKRGKVGLNRYEELIPHLNKNQQAYIVSLPGRHQVTGGEIELCIKSHRRWHRRNPGYTK